MWICIILELKARSALSLSLVYNYIYVCMLQDLSYSMHVCGCMKVLGFVAVWVALDKNGTKIYLSLFTRLSFGGIFAVVVVVVVEGERCLIT